MDAPTTNFRVRWLVGAAVVSLSVVIGWAAVHHGVAAHWARSPHPEQWLRAAAWEPDNPEHWYRLGRYYQTDFENADLPQAISYYHRATEIAPGSAQYWLDLAEAEETALHLAAAEQAFRRAEQAYPISAEVSWRFGNFLLRQNRQDEAFREIHSALSVQPGLTALAISRCWQSIPDIERILKLALPVRSEAYWGAIDFLVEAREPKAAMVVWERLMAGDPEFTVQRSFRLQDMLIETGHASDARRVWQQSLSAAGVQPDPELADSLLWNGSFEQQLLNGGLGWRFRPVVGADLSLDRRVARSQGRSLRVTFDGTTNVDFQQPWQYVVVKPNTRYRLTAYFRTEGVTTNSGIQLEIQEAHFGGALLATPTLAATQPWAPSEAEFTTGADTELVRVVLRRRPTQKLDNKIRGTIWVDDVSLVPIVESSTLR